MKIPSSFVKLQDGVSVPVKPLPPEASRDGAAPDGRSRWGERYSEKAGVCGLLCHEVLEPLFIPFLIVVIVACASLLGVAVYEQVKWERDRNVDEWETKQAVMEERACWCPGPCERKGPYCVCVARGNLSRPEDAADLCHNATGYGLWTRWNRMSSPSAERVQGALVALGAETLNLRAGFECAPGRCWRGVWRWSDGGSFREPPVGRWRRNKTADATARRHWGMVTGRWLWLTEDASEIQGALCGGACVARDQEDRSLDFDWI